MFLKHFLGRRSVATVIAAAEKLDVAWTAVVAINTVVVWGASVLVRTEPAPAPENTAIVLITSGAVVLPDEPVRLPFAELAANDNKYIEAPRGGPNQ